MIAGTSISEMNPVAMMSPFPGRLMICLALHLAVYRFCHEKSRHVPPNLIANGEEGPMILQLKPVHISEDPPYFR
jgi:hypothetical protein